MPRPLIRCAKRNVHSDALHRLGPIKVPHELYGHIAVPTTFYSWR